MHVTAVAAVRPVPVMVTKVPPFVEPDTGAMLVKVGTGATWVYVPVAVPFGVVTTTTASPATWAGVTAVKDESLTTERPVAAAPPKVTVDAPVKLVPVITTEFPPRIRRFWCLGPVFGNHGWPLRQLIT